jgi:hypothetical protein
MNKFQPFSFSSVNELLDTLPPNELKLVVLLRNLILQSIPGAKEKLSYNVPYYFRHSRTCFIWPGSVPWGKTIKQGVTLGFCKGHLLTDPSYLETGNRKEVFAKTFYSTKDIDRASVQQLLCEAVVIDEESKRFKK